jgi:hypothetical protein
LAGGPDGTKASTNNTRVQEQTADQEGVQVLTVSNDETLRYSAIVREALGDVRSRWRTLARMRLGAMLTAAVAVVWLVAWVAVRTLALDGGSLALAASIALGITIAVAAGAVARRRPAPGDRALARYIEEQCPNLEDRLVTAVEVAGDVPAGGALLRGVMLADASQALREAPLDAVVPRDRIRRAGALAGLGSLALLVAASLWIEPARHVLGIAALYVIPGRLVLQVTPGNARVKRGAPFVIRATTTAGQAGISPELTVTIGGERRTVRMPAAGADRFAWRFDGVPTSFTYSVSAAGRTSDTYTVTALDPPRVARIDLRYEFPEYTRLPPRREEDGGDIYAPHGTRVTLSIHASTGATSGALALKSGARVPLQPGQGGAFEAMLPITADGAYRVALADDDGLTSDGETEYFIHVLNDRPPDVRILRPAGDRQVTPLEEITIEARADDDYGVGAFDLVYSVRGAREKAVPFEGVRDPLSVTGRHTLFLEDLGVAPGDFVTYYARARDVARGRQSTEARSDIFFLEVKPFEEEFASAQSQAGGGSGNRSLEDLVTAQKDIVVATWKLDRRAGAGRSAQDVRAIGRAQGELKGRAERAAAQMRDLRRRPRVVQGDSIGAAPDDPMTSAAAAMGRAASALDAVKTSEALPPEMEALNHLLRAQAEVKRREVTRQQANGSSSGGFNRSQQDLSTLFDRELQRQQQTNYETQKSTEERQDGNQDNSLDRVRELARRQEQLSRQQEDLARDRERLSADELKRRLERLTREQSDLRQQAEEWSRQLGQQQARQEAQDGQAGQRRPGEQGTQGQEPKGEQTSSGGRGQTPGSHGQASADAGSQLREASEEMRGATSDLRRQDPRQASARSNRALERLRSLERQLQGTQPDERRRALGDLQLEARQLADRQRQLGEQAATGASGSNAADARRRIAGEQDRLADRVKRLQEQVTGVAAATRGLEPQAQQALGEAARKIEQERLETRMRESAKALRSAGQDNSVADRATARVATTAREVAHSMDGVADRLGQASGSRAAEDGKLSDQLARTRELKEEMNELQRRIQQLGREAQRLTPEPRGGRAGGAQGGAADRRADASGRAAGQAANSPPSGQPGTGAGVQRELQQLRHEYADRVRQADQLRHELGAERQSASGGTTPVGQEMVGSAPGTEAFKQDFSRWEVLHKDVTLGLERLEASLSQALLERAARDRLKAGGADRAPDEYERAVDAYFRSLAAPKP